MNNNQFAKQLAKYTGQHKSTLITEVEKIDLEKIRELLTFDFGLTSINAIIPLFGKSVLIDKQLTDLIQVNAITNEVTFSVFAVSEDENFYLLIVTPFAFYTNKTQLSANDLYMDSDDFEKFSILLGKQLGMVNVELYESKDGYYFSTSEINSKMSSFFLYKV